MSANKTFVITYDHAVGPREITVTGWDELLAEVERLDNDMHVTQSSISINTIEPKTSIPPITFVRGGFVPLNKNIKP